jgi:hypothetical protein
MRRSWRSENEFNIFDSVESSVTRFGLAEKDPFALGGTTKRQSLKPS